jgi:hypothetical protein
MLCGCCGVCHEESTVSWEAANTVHYTQTEAHVAMHPIAVHSGCERTPGIARQQLQPPAECVLRVLRVSVLPGVLQGHSKHYAFVEFATPEAAQAALKAINSKQGQAGEAAAARAGSKRYDRLTCCGLLH